MPQFDELLRLNVPRVLTRVVATSKVKNDNDNKTPTQITILSIAMKLLPYSYQLSMFNCLDLNTEKQSRKTRTQAFPHNSNELNVLRKCDKLAINKSTAFAKKTNFNLSN